jgi:hypothetical protein
MNDDEVIKEFVMAYNRMCVASGRQFMVLPSDVVLHVNHMESWRSPGSDHDKVRIEFIMVRQIPIRQDHPFRRPRHHDFTSTAEDIVEERELPAPPRQLPKGSQ